MRNVVFTVFVCLILFPLFLSSGKIGHVKASSSIVFSDISDGYLDSNNKVYSTYQQMSLGDWNTNHYSLCFVRFDLFGVSGTLSSARLHVYVKMSLCDNASDSSSPVTNPGLGDCQVIHIVDYGTLDDSDFSATSIDNDPGVLISGSSFPDIDYVSIDVKSAMQDDIDKGRAWSTFMFKMATTTDGDDRNDYWVFGTSETADTSQDPYIEYELALETTPYQGDLVLAGNNVTVIEGSFNINGSIIVLDNATLMLRNAILSFTQTEDWQHGIILTNSTDGNPRLQVSDATITSNYKYSIKLYKNSSSVVHDSAFTALSGGYCWYWTYDSAFASLNNLTARGVSSTSTSGISLFESSILGLNIYSPCSADVEDSSIHTLNSYGTANVSSNRTTVEFIQTFDASKQEIDDSEINQISTYNESSVWLTNSTYSNCSIYDQSHIFVFWNLNVHVVDEIGQSVPSASTTALYQNATAADSKFTNADGWAKLKLMEKVMNATAIYSVGDYIIEAAYETYSKNTNLAMTENRQTTLQLQFIIPESSLFLMSMFLVFATIMIATFRRKK